MYSLRKTVYFSYLKCLIELAVFRERRTIDFLYIFIFSITFFSNLWFNLWFKFSLIPFVVIGSPDVKQVSERDETPPCTPTGSAVSSESYIEVSSSSNNLLSSSKNIIVSQEEDEHLAKELSIKETAGHDFSHRPKRRRFHVSYNMKCPTPGCNSLGEATHTWTPAHMSMHMYGHTAMCFIDSSALSLNLFTFSPSLYFSVMLFFCIMSSNRETWKAFLHIRMSSLPQSLCWWMQGIHIKKYSQLY